MKLGDVKLKKTTDIRDRSGVASGYNPTEEAKRMADYAEQVRAADFDRWATALADDTYRSLIIPLTVAEAKAIVAKCHQYQGKCKLTDSDADLLSHVARRVDDAIQHFGGSAFAKLTSRSAKDATLGRSIAHFRQMVAEIEQSHPATLNERLICLNRAHILALKMTSGEEVLSVFSESDRIPEDLLLALEFPDNFTQAIIVREWMPIPIEYEFRGFVCDGRLNALSQYYVCCYFPHMVAQKDKILRLIHEKWDTIAPKLPVKSVVCDFAVDLDHDRVYVLELNPFPQHRGDVCGTDGALFSWKEDVEVIRNGPFTFRYETSEDAAQRVRLTDQFRRLVDNPHGD